MNPMQSLDQLSTHKHTSLFITENTTLHLKDGPFIIQIPVKLNHYFFFSHFLGFLFYNIFNNYKSYSFFFLAKPQPKCIYSKLITSADSF